MISLAASAKASPRLLIARFVCLNKKQSEVILPFLCVMMRSSG